MGVSTTSVKDFYVGNNVTPTFDFNFKIQAKSDLIVKVKNTLTDVISDLVLNVDYSIADDQLNKASGQIVLIDNSQDWLVPSTNNLNIDHRIMLRYEADFLQDVDFKNSGPYRGVQHENRFDTQTLFDQFMREVISRGIYFDEWSSQTSLVIPELEAGGYLALNMDGTALVWRQSSISSIDWDQVLNKPTNIENLDLIVAGLAAHLTNTSLEHDAIYLNKANEDAYTPTEPYHPATKDYVDSTAGVGEANTMSSAGSGASIVLPKNIYDLPVKGFKAAKNNIIGVEETDDSLVHKLTMGENDQVLESKIRSVIMGTDELNTNYNNGSWIVDMTVDRATGVIYAVNNSNNIVRSKDGGDTWNTITVPFANDYAGVCCGDGKVFITGYNNGTTAYSEDEGDTWVNITPGSNVIFGNDIAYGNGTLIVYSRFYNNYRLYINGSWSSVYTDLNSTGIDGIAKLTYGNGFFAIPKISGIAALDTNSSTVAFAQYLVDGLKDIVSCAYGNGYWVAVASDISTYRAKSLRSWTNVTGVLPGVVNNGVVFNGKFFTIMPSSTYDTILYSIDGKSWSNKLISTADIQGRDWRWGFMVDMASKPAPYFLMFFTGSGSLPAVGKIAVAISQSVSWVEKKSPIPTKIVATQRTFKTTNGDADIPASDALTGFVASSWQRRALNNFIMSDMANEFFMPSDFGSPSASIKILKPGKYKVSFSVQFRRTNFCQILCQYNVSGQNPNFKIVKGRTATTVTAVGHDQSIAASFVLNVTPARVGGGLFLDQWAETNSSNERWGLWFVLGNDKAPLNFTDTCSIEIEWLGDV